MFKSKAIKKPTVVCVSGYFNPLHVGHLEMIERAKKLGDKLVSYKNNHLYTRENGNI